MSTKKNSEWEVTAERFVGFIDIMGFKDMVLKSTHNEIYEMMKQIDDTMVRASEIRWGQWDVEYIKTTTYSDSIIIYSKDDSSESALSFICSISGLIYDLFQGGIPHKGAFAFGTMTLDTTKSIFFGRPLIDAYLLQDELKFYGMVGHGSAEAKIHELNSLLSTEDKFLFIVDNFECMFKAGNAKHMVIYPMNVFPTETLEEEHKELLKSFNKLRYKTSGALRKYVDNTELFWDFVKNKWK